MTSKQPADRNVSMGAFKVMARLHTLPDQQGYSPQLKGITPGGSFYPVLNALLRENLIDQVADDGRKRYGFTPTGRRVFLQERAALLSLLEQNPRRNDTDTENADARNANAGNTPDQTNPHRKSPQQRAPSRARAAEPPGPTGPSPITDDLLRELSLFLLLPDSTREGHRQSLVLLGKEDAWRSLLGQARAAISTLHGRDGTPLKITCNERPYPRSRREARDTEENLEQVSAQHPDLKINVWTKTGLLGERRRPQGLNAQEQAVLTAVHQGSSLRSRQIYVGDSFDLRRETHVSRSYLNGRVKILALWTRSWAEHDQQLSAFWQAGGPLSADPQVQLSAYRRLGHVPTLTQRTYHAEQTTTRLGMYLSERRYQDESGFPKTP